MEPANKIEVSATPFFIHLTGLYSQSCKFLIRYGTLLAHSCRSSLILGNNTELIQSGHCFGLEIALAWQVNECTFAGFITLTVYENG